MRKAILSLLLCASLTSQAQVKAESPQQLAEKMFGFVINNQSDSLYHYLTRQMKLVIAKEQMDGILRKAEEKFGKYQSHGSWEVMEMSGSKTCTATVEFEKAQMGALVIFDPSNYLIGVQIVPVQAIKKDN